jgi:hypothetical protein
VTLVDGGGDVVTDSGPLHVGPDYRNHSTAAATRIVTGGQCPTTTCRIEVRIW